MRARGLRKASEIRISCRPGALTGRFSKHALRVAIVFVVLQRVFAGATELAFDFSTLKPGDAPSGFRSVAAGTAKPGEWKIVTDETPAAFPAVIGKAPTTSKRPVLAQLSRDRTDEHTPMFIYEGETFGEFKVTTLFKLAEGEVEQMAGIAFGFHDANNYYYVRASGLGNSFYFFKIINGQRSPPIGAKTEIPKGAWHEMSVECKGNTLRASLNGKELITVREERPFAGGKIGYWTKSDSVSYFSDTRVIYTPRERIAEVVVREALAKHPRLRGLQVFAGTSRDHEPKLIASNDATELGRPAPPEVRDVLARSIPYHGKDRDNVIITLPLRDRNGENVAAVKVIMKSFPGQTEKNALARALPIARWIETRIQTRKDFIE